jgi:acetolactate synthase-1/2/3 large subunit
MTVSARDVPRLDLNDDPQCCAAWIAKMLKARGIDRIFGLQGGHIQPIWDYAAQEGIRIIDVRDERTAVHMAHAHAELTGGFGVAMVTAGPGVTNTVTSMANASLARVPVLADRRLHIAPAGQHGPAAGHTARRHPQARVPLFTHGPRSRPGDPRNGRGDRTGIRRHGRARPCLYRDPDRCSAHPCSAATGAGRMDGRHAACASSSPRRMPSSRRQTPFAVPSARWSSPGAARAVHRKQLVRFLDAADALYLDTQESRGLVPTESPRLRRCSAWRGDGPVRPCDRAGPQAGLPDGIRFACRLWRRPLHPHLRHRRRVDRQPARQPGTAG